MKHFHRLLADSASTQSEHALSSGLVTFISTTGRRDGLLHPPKDCLLKQVERRTNRSYSLFLVVKI